jgi:Rrf2 family protein
LFSQTTEYALRAVAFVAGQSPRACTTDEISRATQVPPAYLSKVIQALARGGVLASRRGVGGGVSLAKETCQITILDIVNAVDPLQRIKRCPIGLAAHGVQLCPLHRRVDDAIAQVEQAFASTTLAEMLAEEAQARQQKCRFPRVKSQ